MTGSVRGFSNVKGTVMVFIQTNNLYVQLRVEGWQGSVCSGCSEQNSHLFCPVSLPVQRLTAPSSSVMAFGGGRFRFHQSVTSTFCFVMMRPVGARGLLMMSLLHWGSRPLSKVSAKGQRSVKATMSDMGFLSSEASCWVCWLNPGRPGCCCWC